MGIWDISHKELIYKIEFRKIDIFLFHTRIYLKIEQKGKKKNWIDL